MIFGVAFMYILGIFRLADAAKAIVSGPETVLLLALLVKMGGSKLQLLLKNLLKVPLRMSKVFVFFYEHVTALLIRMLLLSIPNVSAAIYLSLLNAALELELMTRAWFFVGYISTGGKQLAGLEGDSSTLHHAFVRRGQLRVLAGCNDAMVEYMTMLEVVGILPATEVFNLPTDEKVALDTLLRVLGVQIAVELAVDTFIFALEANGGLVPLQLQYWKRMSLGVVCIQLLFGWNWGDRIGTRGSSPGSVIIFCFRGMVVASHARKDQIKFLVLAICNLFLRNFWAQNEGDGVICELQKQQFIESLARD
jgi:hypothetical protein